MHIKMMLPVRQVFGQQSQQGVSGCTNNTSCAWICTPRPDGRHRCLCPDGLRRQAGDKCVCPGGGTPFTNGTCPPGESTDRPVRQP